MNKNASVLNKVDYDEVDKRVQDVIDERTSNLPSKTEFFGKMDEVLGEVKGMRRKSLAPSY
ncbi:MAG: hypothetical protein WAV40_04205 [Microgenomates group bacterium]